MRSPRLIIAAVAALAVALLAAGCGSSSSADSLDAAEGMPIELGDVSYNVFFSRQLNPNDLEDQAYLRGAPKLPVDQFYLGVFLQVTNHSDSTQNVPREFQVLDTEGNRFNSVPLDNEWALKQGEPIQPGETLPLAESPAANGPIQGSMVLFLVDQTSNENRPLQLEIPSPSTGEVGRIELDL